MKTDTVKMQLPPENLDQEAHRLRQAIYGPISDDGWNKIKVNWIVDLPWLRRTAEKMNRS